MSFGWSVGDIINAIELIYEVSEALRSSTGSPDDRIRANGFLSTFDNAIVVVRKIYGPNLPLSPGSQIENADPAVPPPTEAELRSVNELKELYDKLKGEIGQYAGMNKLPNEIPRNFVRRQIQKVSWHFFARKNIQDLRSKITAQVQLLQPSLEFRQHQTTQILAQGYHEENQTNFSDIKTMMRVFDHKLTILTSSLSTLQPNDPSDTSISRASTLLPSDPEDYTGYYNALQQISPFVPTLIASTIATSLHRLKCTHKLHSTLKSWLTNLDSSSPQSNILWLLDVPTSTQISSILFSVLTTLARPVLAFNCTHISPLTGKDIPPETLLTNLLYRFLHTLLGYLNSHLSTLPRQRIDAPSFAQLDGTPTSTPTALTLLGNLLDDLPCPAVCIIDNFQHLDKPANKPHLHELFALFARRTTRTYASFQGSHKLLLTTTGGTGTLLDMSREKTVGQVRTRTEVGVGGSAAGMRYAVWAEVKSMVEGVMVVEKEGEAGSGQT